MRPIDADALVERTEILDDVFVVNWTTKKVQSLINAAPTIDAVPVVRWIPVTERLPDESNGTVLVCHADKAPYNIPEPFPHAEHDRRVVIGSHSEHTGTWYCSMGGTLHDVTHWMPLPDPPCADMRKEKPEA